MVVEEVVVEVGVEVEVLILCGARWPGVESPITAYLDILACFFGSTISVACLPFFDSYPALLPVGVRDQITMYGKGMMGSER